MAKIECGYQPTFLVKAKTSLLKYVTLDVAMKASFTKVDNKLLYTLTINDDVSQPTTIWSFAEDQVEIEAANLLMQGCEVGFALFNEVSANVAFSVVKALPHQPFISPMSATTSMTSRTEEVASIAKDRMNLLDSNDPYAEGWQCADLARTQKWKFIENHFVTEMAVPGRFDISTASEGDHQEAVAFWLGGSLKPGGCFHSPQVPDGRRTREMTDILLTSQYGSILIESKCLTILGRGTPPDRTKLRNDVAKMVKKAASQLKGALRMLRSKVDIRSKTGEIIEVERNAPPHAIILVPDLDLLDPREYGLEFMKGFICDARSNIHILDISELTRMIQAANMISEGSRFTPVEAFDYYLTQRSDITFSRETLCIEVLMRRAEQ